MPVIQVADCQTAADVWRVARLGPARRRALNGPVPAPFVVKMPEPEEASPVPSPISRWRTPVIEEIIDPPVQKLRMMAHSFILSAVGNHFGLTKSDLIDHGPGSRLPVLARPRQVAMYLMREVMGYSWTKIGHCVGDRDHTTALHAHRKTQTRRNVRSEFARTIDKLEDLIRFRLHKPNGVIYRKVPLQLAEDYTRLGWIPTTTYEDTLYAEHCVLMKWICPSCPMVEPRS
jgi:Bacterial dnaA protein helix-turn-helix